MSSFEEESKIISELEVRSNHLKQSLEEITNGEILQEDEKLAQIILENTKLKHRLTILKKAINEEKIMCGDTETPEGLISVMDYLKEKFKKAILKAYPNLPDVPVVITVSNNSKFNDYQCNSAMPVSKTLKETGVDTNPRAVGMKIAAEIAPCSVISKVDVAGAGFINIFLNRQYTAQALTSIILDGVKPPKVERKRIIVDFSSPNIAKEMHVGHLRSTIIGESICRLLEFFNHDVVRINHVGDWGTQFGMLIAHLQEEFPNYLLQSPPIEDLQTFYKTSKVRFDSDEQFKKRSYEAVVNLQSHHPDYIKAWQMICDVSRAEFQKIYDKLDIKIMERGESYYQKHMELLVDDLQAKGFLEEDEGRMIMWGIDREGIPLTIIKTGGGFTYDTSDMAAIKQRIEEEKADWIIYVTDNGQAIHFSTIFSCATRADILNPEKHRVDHVGFGLVLGEDGKKFKTRSGDTVKLINLLDEGLKRSMEKLREKSRDSVLTTEELRAAQESVAYGCIKYADLSKNRTCDYVFSFDRMLEDKGNTAVYLLYAYTRIKSIARNCGSEYVKNLQKIARNVSFKFEHEKEFKLAKSLIKFPHVIVECCNDLLIHRLCDYIYEICTCFSEFYDNCYCIEKDQYGTVIKINDERVLLSEATALIMEKCFYILGLKPIGKI